jgi:hypothetical protein
VKLTSRTLFAGRGFFVRKYQNLGKPLFGTKKSSVLFLQKEDSARLSGYLLAC